MNEWTAEHVLATPTLQSEHLHSLFETASAQLYSGEDLSGIGSVLCAIDTLERMVENDQNSPQPRIELALLLPAVRTLYSYIQNKDIAGIADLLRCTFCPLTEQWMRGGGGI